LGEASSILHVKIKHGALRSTLVLSGEIDPVSGARLRAAIDRAMGDGATSLDFDFTRVSFMDSTGLSILATTSERVVKAGGTVRVRNASPTVIRLLEVTRLDSVIDVA
jgi:anti-sigma B factor antagonist